MKVRNSSRITALVLALMMIVPLISVPTFAADATPIWTQDFSDETVGLVNPNNQNASNAITTGSRYNQSAKIADLGGVYGKAYLYDLSMGPQATFEGFNEDKAFTSTDRKDNWTALTALAPYPGVEDAYYEVEGYEKNPDGTYTGIANGKLFINATRETYDATSKNVTGFAYTEEVVNEVDGYGATTGKQITIYKKGLADSTTYYLVSAAVRNARSGSMNIGNRSYVKLNNVTSESKQFVYSADYFFSSGWSGTLDINLGQTLPVAQIAGDGMRLNVRVHNDVKNNAKWGTSSAISGSSLKVLKNQWFNLSIYMDYENATFTLYVNGNKCQTASIPSTVEYYGRWTNVSKALASDAWNLGHNTRGVETERYGGHYYVDNLAIYDASSDATAGVPAATALPEQYIQSTDFASYNWGLSSWSASKVLSNDYDGFNHGPALYFDLQNNYSGLSDKGAMLTNTEIKPSVGTVYLAADYYLAPGSRIKLQSQIYKVTNANSVSDSETVDNNSASQTYLSLFYIEATEDGRAWLIPHGENTFYGERNLYNTAVPVGEWFTITNKVNLVTGMVEQYVNGYLAATFYISKNKVGYSNFTIPANAYIAAKTSKNTADSSGYYLLDNVQAYTQEAYFTQKKTDKFVSDDFENNAWAIGDLAVGAYLNGSAAPSFATYASDPLDASNTVAKFSFAADATGDDAILEENLNGGINVDCRHHLYTPEYRYDATPGANNTYLFSADYYASSEAQGVVESQIVNYYLDPATGKNVTKFLHLYRLDLVTNQLKMHGTPTADLKMDAWNTIQMIVTLTETGMTVEVYCNGVFAHEVSYDYNFIVANAWSIAKTMKNPYASNETPILGTGYYYVDNASVQAVDEDEKGFLELYDTDLTVLVNGETVKLYNTDGRFYGLNMSTVENGEYLDLYDYDGMINTLSTTSIRLSAPTGLRFATEINVDLLEALKALDGVKSVKIGTAIAPQDMLDLFGLDLDIAAIQAAGKPVLKVEATEGKWYQGIDEDEATTHFVGSIVNFQSGNEIRAFSAAGYVEIALTNGNTIYIYSGVTTDSAAECAARLIANTEYYESLDSEKQLVLDDLASLLG